MSGRPAENRPKSFVVHLLQVTFPSVFRSSAVVLKILTSNKIFNLVLFLKSNSLRYFFDNVTPYSSLIKNVTCYK